MQVVTLPARPATEPIVASPHARAYVLPPAAPLPDGADAAFDLADGSRFVYAPEAPGTFTATLAVDPFVRGNSFKPLHDSPRALSALLSVAAGRRVDTGPESERLFLILRGVGLLFEENGDTHRIEPNSVALVPPGGAREGLGAGPR